MRLIDMQIEKFDQPTLRAAFAEGEGIRASVALPLVQLKGVLWGTIGWWETKGTCCVSCCLLYSPLFQVAFRARVEELNLRMLLQSEYNETSQEARFSVRISIVMRIDDVRCRCRFAKVKVPMCVLCSAVKCRRL
jgi:hypothetical protein